MPGSWRRSGILEEPAPTSQCLAQDFPLSELKEERLVIPCSLLPPSLRLLGLWSPAAAAAAAALADGAAAFGECFLNHLNKGGR